jgi:iron complex outermembrane receptor protein
MNLFLRALPILALGAATTASSVAAQEDTRPFADMSIEELMNVPVTSVSKRATRLSESPAAIAVVTAEEIRRLGITTLPEALRLVPGMDVARVTGNEWAVSARGFNSQFATKLLVLIDGRTVYTPASAGVFWNAQDVLLEDLDRIEVIRGPGAALWGANAVSGVINIITKSAREAQGGLVSTSLGTEDRPSAAVRYGGQLAPDLYYRVYAKYFDRDGLVDSAGRATPDGWHMLRSGFRADWAPSTANDFLLEGDYYRGRAGKRVNEITLAPPAVRPLDHLEPNSGGHVLGRWTRTFSEASQLTLQTYYDHVEQGDGFGVEYRNTGDFDLQHRLAVGERNDVVWGAGYRYASVNNTPSFNLTWTPQRHHLQLFNLFVQDEITLAPDRLQLILGSKFEHNNLSGWAIQPNVRLLWTPAAHQAAWAAVARATRTPSLFERSARLNVGAFQPSPASPPFLVSFFGNPQVEEEELLAYELGWRIEPTSQLSFDLAAFHHVYDDLIAFVNNPTVFEPSPAPPHLLVSGTEQNALKARTHGAELSVQWQPVNHWRWVGSYTWLHTRVRPDRTAEGESPQQQLQIRSYLDLPNRWELNGALYYVDRVTSQSGGDHVTIDAYLRLDLGLTWRPTPALELGLWGQNLIEARHSEYASQQSALLTQVPRGISGRATWRF